MKDIGIAPSILAADFGYLMRDIKAIEKNADCLHIDVMDGHYVNNISFGIPVIQSIRKYTDMKFFTHLMITNPGQYIKVFAESGSDNITFHVECSEDPDALIEEIKSMGKSAGIAVHPDTPIEDVFPFIGKVDIILVMTVYPGFGGQGYLDISDERLRKLRKAIDDQNADTVIAVDGGVTEDNIKHIYDAGARLFVAGSSVFHAEDPEKAIDELKRCATLS
ncbi:MAG: ribulose-phosphate 3-epimerase [Saccharofermentans sp.]|jgi:ribulose-phosphate 3-epimerase|nr:ribulose-phosphate 3-epimerase [Clostridiales bacterium]MCR5383120.1 ribulose-phosphate 3-epimerase [Saccharofermentans sp.]